MTSILPNTRRTPCCDRPARFSDLMPVSKVCRCGRKYRVTFESAVGASALVQREVWRCVWTEVAK